MIEHKHIEDQKFNPHRAKSFVCCTAHVMLTVDVARRAACHVAATRAALHQPPARRLQGTHRQRGPYGRLQTQREAQLAPGLLFYPATALEIMVTSCRCAGFPEL